MMDKVMNFDAIFYPKSVAIVGASREIGSVGNTLVKNMVSGKFTGEVYCVNPHATEIEGIPCFPNLTAIGKPIACVIIAVKAPIVASIIKEAHACGIPAAIIISAGFKEEGGEGIQRENELIQLVKEYDMTVIGPNCLGILNPPYAMNASFAPDMPSVGGAAFVSQSGALCTAVIDYAKHLNLGFSKFVSIGNKACVNEVDLFTYFAQDDATRVVMAYIEDVEHTDRFLEAAYKLTHGANAKPVLLLKSGKTDAGKRASVSHTGALGGNNIYYDALFRQSGVLRVDTIPELFTAASAFLYNKLPEGNRTAVVTNAGGPGILVTDAAVDSGLSVPTLTTTTCSLLTKTVSTITHCNNPIDLLGDATTDRYEKALTAVCADDAIDAMLVLLTPQGGTPITEIAKSIVEVKKTTDKPIIVSFMGQYRVLPGVDILKKGNVAVCDYPEDAAKALGLLAKFAKIAKENHREIHGPIIPTTQPFQTGFVPEYQALKLLGEYGLPVVKSGFVTSPSDAKTLIRMIGVPCAMKIVSPDITHKSDVGGVLLDVTENIVEQSYKNMMQTVQKNAPHAKLEGVLLAEMVKEKGIELIIGAARDPVFGVVIMVGFGGVTVEVFNDIAFGISPISQKDTLDMLNELHMKKLFDHFRGGPEYDRLSIVHMIQKVEQLMLEHQEISELDINPCILMPDGKNAKIVDVRIAVK